jgi:Uma2 family endonuclease
MGKVRLQRSVDRVTKPEAVPELRDGDRMSRDEFERRYDASPHVRKAELINGVVYIGAVDLNGKASPMPPVSNEGHALPHFDIIGWLAIYRMATPGVVGGDNPSVRLPSRDNMPQPDGVLRVLPSHGGQTRTDPDDILAGAPELIVEVSVTSAGLDLGPKLERYQQDGVQEYIVWRPVARVLDWFRRTRQGEFAVLPPDPDGIFRSRAFPGLWLDSTALTTGDMARVLAVALQGIASPKHAKFVEKLRKRAAKKKR